MRQRFLVFLITALIGSAMYFNASATEPAAQAPTRIEANTEDNRIDFYVDGELMAVLKDDGFHVREGLNYGGMLTDYGMDHFHTSFAGGPSTDATKGGDDE